MEAPGVLRGHSRALDGIRAFAVLAVIASHLAIPGARGGGFGVLVFFVLSGFLITSILLRERDRTGRIGLGAFYMRRALRLFPALALVIAATLVACVTVLSGAEGDATIRATPAAIFYYANWEWFARGTGRNVLGYFGHFWSLSVEEQFYLIWPPVLILLLRRGRERALPVVLGVVCVVPLLIRLATSHTAGAFFGTHAIADQLAIGALLAGLLHAGSARLHTLVRMGGWPAAAFLVALMAVARVDHPGAWGVFSSTVAISLAALASAVIVGHVVTVPAGWLSRALSLGPLVFIGRISYGMYLWHILVLNVALTRYPMGWKMDLLVYVATTAIAAASYLLWERRWLRLKDSLAEVPLPALVVPA